LKIHAKGGTINIYKSMRGRKKNNSCFLKRKWTAGFSNFQQSAEKKYKNKKKTTFQGL
jgi:hypothetical protein